MKNLIDFIKKGFPLLTGLLDVFDKIKYIFFTLAFVIVVLIFGTKKVTADFQKLILSIENTDKTNNFEVIKLPYDEFIEGKKGAYFFIDIINSETNEIFFFEKGSYILEYDRKFLKSLKLFKKKVLDDILENKKYEIIIQGEADKLGNNSFSRNQVTNFRIETVKYHKKIKNSNNLYSMNESSISIPKIYSNKHLPYLRAKYLKQIVNNTIKDISTKIIEGKINSKIGEEYRNSRVYLYIPEE